MLKKAKDFIEDVQTEMKKVSWPETNQLLNSTIVVIVISILFTLYIFFVDQIVTFLIKYLY